MPTKRSYATLPTKIEKLDRLSKSLEGPEIYIKRDDQTGLEFSGNKIRKLEYLMEEALQEGADALITCGAIQSNHCRATAALGAKLGIPVYLVLKENREPEMIGNYLLDHLFGADIQRISEADYQHRRGEILEELATQLKQEGKTPYIIPEGASNGLGCFGYRDVIEEIQQQEKALGFSFDTVVVPTGSGSTLGGLILGKAMYDYPGEIIGFNIAADAKTFQHRISLILQEAIPYIDTHIPDTHIPEADHPLFAPENIQIIDGYVGEGYGKSRKVEWHFLQHIARSEGILLDPVYTGKALYGLTEEIKKGTFDNTQRILFIHTGGVFGLIPPSTPLR